MQIIAPSSSGFEKYPMKEINGKGFGDFFRGLARSFGNVIRPIGQKLFQSGTNYAKNRLLPQAGKFLTNTVIPQGSQFLTKTLSDATSNRGNFSQNFKANLANTGRNIINEGARRGRNELRQASQFGQQLARQGIQDVGQNLYKNRRNIARQGARNLRKGNNSGLAPKIGNLLDRQLKGSGINKL